MHKFNKPLSAGVNPITDAPVIGIVVNDMHIFDPFQSECGRFEVDPVSAYGLTIEDAHALRELNKLVENATQAALSAGCRHVQETLGIPSGDVAGLFFDSGNEHHQVANAMAQYILEEYRQLYGQIK